MDALLTAADSALRTLFARHHANRQLAPRAQARLGVL
jgi:hypothetical protein